MHRATSSDLAAPAALLAIVLAARTAPAAVAAPPAAGDDIRRNPVVDVVERVSPAVVNISAESLVRERDPFFGGLLGRSRRAVSLGSGLIVDPAGVVVTNAHVIEGASRITVTTLDGRELPADVVGSDRDADLAVLSVAAHDLPAVGLGTASDLLIGETVVAIGNPYGLSHSVTAGTLSARGRALPTQGAGETRFTDFLQTDASINPGNSGGPLVDLRGVVIGINTAIISGANGIGFAIPADRARRVVADLRRYGETRPLWSGLRLTTVDVALARAEDLPVERGARVDRVVPGSPAAAAGFAAGDVVVAIAGQPVAAREDVTTALYSAPPGDALPVAVRRGERRLTLSLAAERPPRGLGLELLERTVGLTVAASGGRLVVQRVAPGTPAAARGLRPGDAVLAANGQRVGEPAALGREVLRSFDRGSLFLVVQRGRFAYNLSLPV